jgi:hypothetical protein
MDANVVKLFDRPYVCDTVETRYGLILIKSIFNDKINEIDNILDSFIHTDIFKILLHVATINVKSYTCGYITNENKKFDGFYFHPLLVKSVLRFIDKSLSINVIIKILTDYKSHIWIDMPDVINCSLVYIVNNVKKPINIINNKNSMEYKCEHIMDNNDMFNDDLLIVNCVKYIINDTLYFLPQCLCDIICYFI